MKTKFTGIKITLILFIVAVIFSNCSKNKIRSATVEYITDFYGVNKEYSNIIAHPSDSSKSLKVVIKWDVNGIASYTTSVIAKVAGNDAPGALVLLPPTEYNKDSAFIKPTNLEVKTQCLVVENGVFSVQTISVKMFICCTNYGFGPPCMSTPFWEVNPSNGWSGWSCGPHCYATPCILTTSPKRPLIYYQAAE